MVFRQIAAGVPFSGTTPLPRKPAVCCRRWAAISESTVGPAGTMTSVPSSIRTVVLAGRKTVTPAFSWLASVAERLARARLKSASVVSPRPGGVRGSSTILTSASWLEPESASGSGSAAAEVGAGSAAVPSSGLSVEVGADSAAVPSSIGVVFPVEVGAGFRPAVPSSIARCCPRRDDTALPEPLGVGAGWSGLLAAVGWAGASAACGADSAQRRARRAARSSRAARYPSASSSLIS